MFLLSADENVWQWLNKWDTWLFLKINTRWTTPLLDNIFPVWREANTWIPLYLFLVLLIFFNFGWKAWPYIVFIAVTIAVSDQLSSSLFKDWFNRPRPCRDPFLQDYVRLLLNRCPASGSFTSSHATNHFAAAVFFYHTLKPWFKKYIYLFFFWAATISYGQVYVGVHYPLDIIGGAVLGTIVGYGMSWVYKKYLGLPETLPVEAH